MWICLSSGFFSIVANKGDDRLVVRARRQGDIERVFGVGGVWSPGRDYAYRVFLERDVVASVVMCCVLGITATNFKDSVKDPALHAAYSATWSVLGRLQVGGPYGHGNMAGNRRDRSLFCDDLTYPERNSDYSKR